MQALKVSELQAGGEVGLGETVGAQSCVCVGTLGVKWKHVRMALDLKPLRRHSLPLFGPLFVSSSLLAWLAYPGEVWNALVRKCAYLGDEPVGVNCGTAR